MSQNLSFLTWDYETHSISLFLQGNFNDAIRLKVTPLWVTLVSHASESQSFFFELGSSKSQYKLVFARQFQKRNQIEGNVTVSHTGESLCESQSFFFELGLWNWQYRLVFARQFQWHNQIEGSTTVSRKHTKAITDIFGLYYENVYSDLESKQYGQS